MKCEEFEAIGLGLQREDRPATESVGAEYAAAVEHLNRCARCAALQEAWVAAQVELRMLGAMTQQAAAPPRVEMRLRQEFRKRHRTLKARAAAVFGAWVLATAALLVGAIGWWNWRMAQQRHETAHSTNQQERPKVDAATNTNNEPVLIADGEAGDFTLLPGSLPQDTEDAAILRVRLQRGALGAFGLPVNQESTGEWLQVDLLVGEDGQPHAIRLPNQMSE